MRPSLLTRFIIGKSVGFCAGLLGFGYLYHFNPELVLFRWGILFWYTTFGAIIASFGATTYHPILKLSMPWWFRGAWLGGWLNFVLTLFAYTALAHIMTTLFGQDGLLTSPFWFVLEGMFLGLLIDYLATRYGGEGTALTKPY